MNRRLTAILMLAVIFAWAIPAHAVRIGDITRLKGRRTNKLVGMGLVVGLTGTGDGGTHMPAIRPLASLLKRFNDPVFDLTELKDAKNVAIVMVEVTVPDNGAREGDQLDVQISSIGSAKSLAGGRLLLTPLQGPSPQATQVLALAGGPVIITNQDTPTVGMVRAGATMERSILHTYVVRGGELEHRMISIDPTAWYITLVIEDAQASHEIASVIAREINQLLSKANTYERWAVAADARNVIVKVPTRELPDLAAFIGKIETHELIPGETMVASEARVRINRSTGTIVVTGDVEISPAVITHKGMTIRTVTPEPVPTAAAPDIENNSWIALNTTNVPSVTQTRKLSDLLAALNQLKLTIDDRIAIIEALHETGKLHAKLQLED